MWDHEKYSRVLGTIKKQCKSDGVLFKGQNIESKEQLYVLIGEEVHVERDTAKGWTRNESKGPGENSQIESIERFLGLPVGELGRREERPKMKKETKNVKLTDFSKKAIMHCYILMKEYIRCDQVEEEERFLTMLFEIEKQRIAIPDAIYQKIQDAIDEFLTPIVYETQATFSNCFTEEIGHYEDGAWHIKDEEAARKSVINFTVRLVEIERSIDDFAMEQLYPLLVEN